MFASSGHERKYEAGTCQMELGANYEEAFLAFRQG
jgi:hypothetical protein